MLVIPVETAILNKGYKNYGETTQVTGSKATFISYKEPLYLCESSLEYDLMNYNDSLVSPDEIGALIMVCSSEKENRSLHNKTFGNKGLKSTDITLPNQDIIPFSIRLNDVDEDNQTIGQVWVETKKSYSLGDIDYPDFAFRDVGGHYKDIVAPSIRALTLSHVHRLDDSTTAYDLSEITIQYGTHRQADFNFDKEGVPTSYTEGAFPAIFDNESKNFGKMHIISTFTFKDELSLVDRIAKFKDEGSKLYTFGSTLYTKLKDDIRIVDGLKNMG